METASQQYASSILVHSILRLHADCVIYTKLELIIYSTTHFHLSTPQSVIKIALYVYTCSGSPTHNAFHFFSNALLAIIMFRHFSLN